jgi:hypothetical protein
MLCYSCYCALKMKRDLDKWLFFHVFSCDISNASPHFSPKVRILNFLRIKIYFDSVPPGNLIRLNMTLGLIYLDNLIVLI